MVWKNCTFCPKLVPLPFCPCWAAFPERLRLQRNRKDLLSTFCFFLTKVLSASAAVEVFPDGFPTLVYLLPNIVLFEYNPPRESIIFSSFLFQYGVEELYILSQAGSTPVLSLLGGLSGKTSTAAEPERPFVNESNIIMYLDMVNERSVELKGIFYL